MNLKYNRKDHVLGKTGICPRNQLISPLTLFIVKAKKANGPIAIKDRQRVTNGQRTDGQN